jgi:hypothetical protein
LELLMKQETQEAVKAVGDALSVFTVVGTLVDMLPSVAALFTIVWTTIRIYESETVQGYIGRRKNRAK